MKDFAVKVNTDEAQVLINLCEKHNYRKRRSVTDLKNVRYINIDHGNKSYAVWPSDDFVPKLSFYKDMDKIVKSFEPEYKVGDWVITEGYHSDYDGRALQITDCHSNDCFYFIPCESADHNFHKDQITRYATPEEIAEAKGEYIMVGEYKVEFLDNKVKVGCLEFDNKIVKSLRNIARFMKNLKKPYQLYVDNNGCILYSGATCDYKTLEAIAKRLKK